MRFRRLSDAIVFDAKVWQRHGDHPVVRPATVTDLPASSDPGRYGWLDGCGIVLPGDWILIGDVDGKPLVVREQSFRKEYAPSSDNL